MLRLSSSHHFLSFHPESSHSPELSAVPVENDELINAIEAEHEQPWNLDPAPDSEALGEFWAGVEDDLHRDPTWQSFADDDE